MALDFRNGEPEPLKSEFTFGGLESYGASDKANPVTKRDSGKLNPTPSGDSAPSKASGKGTTGDPFRIVSAGDITMSEGVEKLRGLVPDDVLDGLMRKAIVIDELIDSYEEIADNPGDLEKTRPIFEKVSRLMDEQRTDALTIFMLGIGALWEIRKATGTGGSNE